MIYIAGKFTAKDRLRGERDQLHKGGFVVNAGWLEEPETDYTASPAYKLECAQRDLVEVVRADILVLDTIDVSDTGGREVELGVALNDETKLIYLVGPERNVFHFMIPEGHRFPTWAALHQYFAEEF